MDLADVIDRATSHALTISESGPLTERSPVTPRRLSRSPTEVSGTFRVATVDDDNVVQRYLLQESRQKQATAEGIQLAALSLRELDCPPTFIAAVARAAEDKIRHADRLAAAAFRTIEPVLPPSDDRALSDLVGFAFETATERCVADTYAAARFAYQAQKAEAEPLRELFGEIARDDARHAALFWDLLAWALSQLSPARGRRIASEQRRVRDALRHAIEVPLPEDLHRYAGVPDVDAGHALVDALEFRLWAEVAA